MAGAPHSKRRKTVKSETGSENNPIEPGAPENPDPPQSCSICYTDDGIRGKIDCCDHFFCFLCIMEWSKTESRCPLCRRRFATIHRPPKAGVFVRSRTFKVPVRDQGYKPFLEQVRCAVCRLSTEESLLMLCDGCDAAAHTFCVGFGRHVPEGDWFCDRCAPHHDIADSDSEDEDAVMPGPFMMRIPPVQNQCAGVMAEVTTPATTPPRVETRRAESVANQSSRSSSGAVSRRLTILMDGVSRPTRTLPSVENRPTESVARTVDRCRNVQSRIQTLRDNWNGYRSGSMSFPSNSVKSACSSSQRPNYGVVIHEASSQQTQSSSSTSLQQLENRESSTSLDVDKAWRMMEISRQLAQEKSGSAVQLSKRPSCIANTQTNVDSCFSRSGQAESSSSACFQRQTNQVGCASRDIDRVSKIMDAMSNQHIHLKTTSSSFQQPKLLSRKASALKETANVNSSFDVCKPQGLGAWDLQRTGREAYRCDSRGKETISYQSVKSEEERQRVGIWGAVESSKAPSISNSGGVSESQCSWRNLKQASDVIPKQSGSASFIGERASSSFIGKPDRNASSSSKLDLEKRKVRGKVPGAESCAEGKAGNVDEAKSEIICLVKKNLKLLSKDKPLGVDAFKEIARRSTHTILAACGLEHRKPGLPSFPSVACRHTDQLHLPHKSSLMPDSCQDCFSGFVKDVVSSILLRSAQLK